MRPDREAALVPPGSTPLRSMLDPDGPNYEVALNTHHPIEGSVYHWWVVDEADWSNNVVLCVAAGENTMEQIAADGIAITISRAVIDTPGVGCKQCLELLHS